MGIGIKLDGVGLDVPHFVQRERSVRSWGSTLLAAATSRLRREYRVLLDDVSFELADGERVALLGRNGAGKTTLLRVLAGTLAPTRGRLEVNGSRQALLNLGLGFNSEATVRENVFLRGTAMGLRPSVIRDLVEPVLEFAGLTGVANHRMATLSSGQRMRLGFAVSTSVQHDIMLLDEWFGAGDAEFVKRARARMSDRVSGSRIVVLASHNFRMLREVCTRGLVMDQGRLAFQGSVDDAIDAYREIYEASPEYQAAMAAMAESPGGQRRERMAELKEMLREQRAEARTLRRKLRRAAARLKEANGQAPAVPDAPRDEGKP